MIIPEISWPQNAAEAIAIQQSLRHKVSLVDAIPKLEMIAGIDVSYDIKNDMSRAVIVLMKIQELKPLHSLVALLPTAFPYVPGLLSFREIPVILKALGMLPRVPDLLMVDGQGIAHPRRFGIAAHLGVLTNMPAIGVAKSRLTGTYIEPGAARGSHTPLWSGKEQIGTVLRSKEKTKPLFISPGHHISQETALQITLQCFTRYRLPEPTRIADKISKNPEPFLKQD